MLFSPSHLITGMLFIENPNDDPSLPEKVLTDIPYFGLVPVTKYHIISLQSDRTTSYGTYITVQNELAAAYNELRNRLAILQFNQPYDELNVNDARREAIESIFPVIISEAEPVNTGDL